MGSIAPRMALATAIPADAAAQERRITGQVTHRGTGQPVSTAEVSVVGQMARSGARVYAIDVRGLRKSYGAKVVLDDVERRLVTRDLLREDEAGPPRGAGERLVRVTSHGGIVPPGRCYPSAASCHAGSFCLLPAARFSTSNNLTRFGSDPCLQ